MKRCLLLLYCWISVVAVVVVKADDSLDDFFLYGKPFEERVANTLQNLQLILNETKSIQRADDQEHTYQDKYLLVEFATFQTWNNLVVHAFPMIGLNLSEVWNQEWQDAGQTVTLHFDGTTKSTLLEEQEVDVKGDGYQVTNSLGISSTTQQLHRVKEFRWSVQESYQIYLCFDSCDDKQKLLKGRTMSTTVTTRSNSEPAPTRVTKIPPLNIVWLFKRFSPSDMGFDFKIDRSLESCKTPRRNEQVDQIWAYHGLMYQFLEQVRHFVMSIYVPPTHKGATLSSHFSNGETVGKWTTALPLLENSTVLNADRIEILHQKEAQDLAKEMHQLTEIFDPASSSTLVSVEEASLLVFVRYTGFLLWIHRQGLHFVEKMIYQQLVQAIGKQLGPSDFRQYMRFHGSKLFDDPFVPRSFAIPVRYGETSNPVGSLALEEKTADGMEPVQLLTRRVSGDRQGPLYIPIDATTKIEITGDHFLSGWIRYNFGGTSDVLPTKLTARARQFSSFVLLVGTVTGPNGFEAKHGIILTNKDEVLIPIITESLPSAKEFKDAISSLSPEQQRFAKLYRKMQLESSVFGICVIQLKPQLEKLMNLPAGSLDKEIKLTEHLTTLFVDHHVPSDLLSYDGKESANATSKVALVKSYVQAVNEIVQEAKDQALSEEKQKAKARHYTAMENEKEEMYDTMTYATQSQSRSSGPSVRPSSMPSGSPSTSPSAAPSSAPSSLPRKLVMDLSQRKGASSPDESLQDGGSESTKRTNTKDEKEGEDSAQPDGDDRIDFTKIPRILDAMLEQHDAEGYLRSMTIKAADAWTLKRKASMLVEPSTSTLTESLIRNEKLKAFDLLDAITRSGSLAIDSSEFHVVVGVSHNFAQSVMKTLYLDNINPIEKAEKSLVLLGREILGQDVSTLLRHQSDLERLSKSFLNLMETG